MRGAGSAASAQRDAAAAGAGDDVVGVAARAACSRASDDRRGRRWCCPTASTCRRRRGRRTGEPDPVRRPGRGRQGRGHVRRGVRAWRCRRLPGWRAEMIGADRFRADSPETPFIRALRPRAAAAGVAHARASAERRGAGRRCSGPRSWWCRAAGRSRSAWWRSRRWRAGRRWSARRAAACRRWPGRRRSMPIRTSRRPWPPRSCTLATDVGRRATLAAAGAAALGGVRGPGCRGPAAARCGRASLAR